MEGGRQTDAAERNIGRSTRPRRSSETVAGRVHQLLKLADNMNKLYLPGTEETRWVEGVLALKKGGECDSKTESEKRCRPENQ